MKLDYIVKKLEYIDEDRVITDPRRVSINIPLISIDNRIHLIFEKRSSNVNQPNDTSFPGGHLEEGETFKEACIRETVEEIGIKKENIKVIKKFGSICTFSNLYAEIFVSEIVGIDIEDFSPDENEVMEVFTVDIDTLLSITPAKYKNRIIAQKTDDFPYHLIKEGRNYKFVEGSEDIFFYKVNGRIIWGFTAGILKRFLDVIDHD